MSQTMDQQTYISAPDDSVKRAIPTASALPPPATIRGAVFLSESDVPGGDRPEEALVSRPISKPRSSLYGMPLVRRGLRLMGWTFLPAGVWFYGYRLFHGKFPVIPTGIVASVALLVLVSLSSHRLTTFA